MLIYEWLAYRVVKRGPDCSSFFWCGKISAFTMRFILSEMAKFTFALLCYESSMFLISVGTEVFSASFFTRPSEDEAGLPHAE